MGEVSHKNLLHRKHALQIFTAGGLAFFLAAKGITVAEADDGIREPFFVNELEDRIEMLPDWQNLGGYVDRVGKRWNPNFTTVIDASSGMGKRRYAVQLDKEIGHGKITLNGSRIVDQFLGGKAFRGQQPVLEEGDSWHISRIFGTYLVFGYFQLEHRRGNFPGREDFLPWILKFYDLEVAENNPVLQAKVRELPADPLIPSPYNTYA